MRAGKLRRRLTIQQATETQGTTGEMAVTWGTFAEVYGAIKPIRGREFWAAKELQATVNTRIVIRQLAGVTPKMQVVCGQKLYWIEAVIDPEKPGDEQQLMCQEIVAT